MISEPNHFAIGMSVTPKFTWTDPAFGTQAEAVSFHLTIRNTNNVLVYSMSFPKGEVTSHTVNQILNYVTIYTWQLVASNANGSSAPANGAFMTTADPSPQLGFLSFWFLVNDEQQVSLPANQPFRIGIKVENMGGDLNQAFNVVFRVWVGDLKDGNLQETNSVSVAGADSGSGFMVWSEVFAPLNSGYYTVQAEIPGYAAPHAWGTETT